MREAVLLSSAVAVLLSTGCGCAPEAPEASRIGLRCARVWYVDDATGGRPSGSGVIVAPGVILTARHVVEDAVLSGAQLMVGVSGLEQTQVAEFRVVEVRTHPDLDVALLRVEAGPAFDLPAVDQAARSPVRGEALLSCGYPAGRALNMQPGYALGTAAFGHLPGVWLSSAWTAPGMSGGPVLSESGELVGITLAVGWTGFETAPHEHYFLPVSAFRGWLREGW